MSQINVKTLKQDFPILSRKIGEHNLVYLDSAATSQKPQKVIDAIVDYYSNHNANVHRGAHVLGDEATELYEAARKKTATFIGARIPQEVIFTKNTTEALNMVARGYALKNLTKDDIILTTGAEHNSNLLPWLAICKQIGAKLEFLTITDAGDISLAELKAKLNPKVKFLVIFHASNVLGTILPVKEICDLAHQYDTKVVVDGSQAVPHLLVNMQSLGCDFYAFSGHKMLGPMGIGVLWGREELLNQTEPVAFGGGMILEFDLVNPRWMQVPDKFEAGTPNVAGAVGLGVAIDYLTSVGMENVRAHELELNDYALKQLANVPDLVILGSQDPKKRTGLVSFTVNSIHAHDIAAVLSEQGICVRSGMHCAMKFHKDLDLAASVRASFYVYNSNEDIDRLVQGLYKAIKVLKK